jgi:hypothetical protein
VHNPDYADGLGTSLKAGIAAMPEDVDGAVVCLGDMPHVDAALIDKLVAAFDPERGAFVVVPSIEGRRGNPVLWSRRFFPDLMQIQGDVGARHLIGGYAEAVAEVSVNGAAALTDVDTPESLSAVKAENERARRHESLIVPPTQPLFVIDNGRGTNDRPLHIEDARARGCNSVVRDRDGHARHREPCSRRRCSDERVHGDADRL